MAPKQSIFIKTLPYVAVAVIYGTFVLKDQFTSHHDRRAEIEEERKKDGVSAGNKFTNYPKD